MDVQEDPARDRSPRGDAVNLYLKSVHEPKKCPEPGCKGVLMQNRNNPRALFCNATFKLFRLQDTTARRWGELVAAARRMPRKRPKL